MMWIVIVGFVLLRRWNGDIVPVIAAAAVLVIGVIAYRAYQFRQQRQRAERIEETDIAFLEEKVESMLADMANRILEVEGHPGIAVTPEAGEYFHKAVATFVLVDEKLASAISVSQLRSLASQLDEALWQLDAAQAVLDGEELPARTQSPEPVAPSTASISLSAVSNDVVSKWVAGGSSAYRRRRRPC